MMQPKPENEVKMSNSLVEEDIDEINNTEDYGQDDESNGWDAVGG